MASKSVLVSKFLVGFCLAVGLAAGQAGCSGGDNNSDAGPDANISDTGAKDTGKDSTVGDGGNDAANDATISDGGGDADAALTNPTSIQIQAVRAAAAQAPADGGTDGGASLPIDNATVTYVKPLIGTDVAGFFVQAEQTGPAIFIAVDPATQTPVPVAGDQVSFVVTQVASVSGVKEATTITSFSRTAQNIALAPLLQDVSAATNLVTALDSYESEYITMNLTVAVPFAASGTGFQQAQVTTAGLSGNASLNLKLRLPTTVQTSLDVESACTATLTGIMFRFGGVAQPSGWVAGDIGSLVCNAPKVKGALATSLTSVVVTFDRNIDNATLDANGDQFTFDNGLTASAATLSTPTQVTVTTSTQVAQTNYTVTVASTLKDTLAKGIDNTANTALFPAFGTAAVLQLNEVNPTIANSLDLVELLVKTGGTLNGITLEQGISTKTTLATLPNLVVAAGDYIVVHLGAATSTTESTSKTQCTDASCYANAWDINGGTTGITYSGRVLIVRAPSNGSIQDAAAFWTGTPPAAFPGDVMSLQGAGAWLPADCSGNPCNTIALAESVSVDWSACGSTAAGASVARGGNADTNTAADWAVGTSSFGATNP